MHWYFDNVNDAFDGLTRLFLSYEDDTYENPKHNAVPLSRTASRNGPVITIEEPATLTYTNPRRRVLSNPIRNANPFFHFVEAMWMLYGGSLIEPLLYYNQNVATYSDDGKTWAGAYGNRWRRADLRPGVTMNQLEFAIQALSNNPTNRRVVLSMYTPRDLYDSVYNPKARDIPCNTEVMFRVRYIDRKGGNTYANADAAANLLDMTVINRSNDMVWGALGSNYVTFSFLQEYIALAIDCLPGVYHQISNNLHAYIDEPGVKAASNLLTSDWLGSQAPDVYTQLDREASQAQRLSGKRAPYLPPIPGTSIGYTPQNLYVNQQEFTTDLQYLFEVTAPKHHLVIFRTPLLRDTLSPMLKAWHEYKSNQIEQALHTVQYIKSADWRIACAEWMERAARRRMRAQADGPQATP